MDFRMLFIDTGYNRCIKILIVGLRLAVMSIGCYNEAQLYFFPAVSQQQVILRFNNIPIC